MDPERRHLRAAQLLGVLAHATRLQIIRLLDQHGALRVNELQAQLNIGQASVSYHLLKMWDLGILSSQRRGKAVYYGLNDPSLATLLPLLISFSRLPPSSDLVPNPA